ECDPGAAMHSHILEVTIDDPVPPSISLSGPLASGQWVSGKAGQVPELTARAADSTGIQKIEMLLGARPEIQTYGCNWSQSSPCSDRALVTSVPGIADLEDGRHTLSVSAVDAAGNPAAASRNVYVDNTPPDPIVPELAGGSSWRRRNGFSVWWTNSVNTASPIVRAHWKLCTADGSCPWRGVRAAEGLDELSDLLVPEPGDYQLRVWLEDAAGNQREANAALSVPIRFDPERPELAFRLPDPDDPLRVIVEAIDRHSGVVGGEVEIRASGALTWHGLRTEREGSNLIAYVDDERFRSGAYEFRAHAWDQAGNEATTGTRKDGSAATIRLPARIATRLKVGVRRSRERGLNADVVTRFGRTVRLSGSLTNGDGQPIDVATIEALEVNPDGTTQPVGLATTGRRGTFRYLVRATHNRALQFRYPGSRRIGAARAPVRIRVPAASSIELNRRKVRNGEAVLFSGQVFTKPLPPAGKLIEMQAYFRGRWRTISTVRAGRNGSWRFPYRFGATLGRVTYRFRAQLPVEGGYPFVLGHSAVRRVLVIGP
ncbi:MAG: hypothetical protein QOD13_1987, partial [Thermoleophilaceae bacterium]|nr:hypothetical protein [Thermoleophilaceae bacterium]